MTWLLLLACLLASPPSGPVVLVRSVEPLAPLGAAQVLAPWIDVLRVASPDQLPRFAFELHGEVFVVELEDRAPARLADVVWRGRVVGQPLGWAQLVVHGDVLTADVRVPGLLEVALRPDGKGGSALQLRDPAGPVRCAVDASMRAAATAPENGEAPAAWLGGAADDGSLIDVLFVYTPAALAAQGGLAGMQAHLEGQIAYTNAVNLASGVAHRMRLVGAEPVAYASSGNILSDVQRLKDPNDGPLDGVHDLRDALAADLVCLLVVAPSAGVAFSLDELSTNEATEGFSVLNATEAPLVFAHETGHNLGLAHDNVPGAPSTVFCYSFGHATAGGPPWRTIMANPPGTLLDSFSSPELSFDGQALGITGVGCPSGAAHAVRSLNDTAPFVANFRVSADGGNAWQDLGAALAGNFAPALGGSGTLVPGSAGSLELTGAAPGAAAVFFLSVESTPVPFKGGTLVPVPFVLALALVTPASGAVPVSWASWSGVPAGVTLYAQWAVQDAGAPAGVGLSNAVAGTSR